MIALLRRWHFAFGLAGFAFGAGCGSDSERSSTGAANAGTGSAGSPTAGSAGAPGGSGRAGVGADAGNDTQAGGSDVGDAGQPTMVGGSGNASGGDDSCGGSCAPPSCTGLVGDECQGGDCCRTLHVAGGTFPQGEPDAFDSTIASFELDEFEVTVGRFRKFASNYNQWLATGNPVAGAGESSAISGSGWQAQWSDLLAEDDTALKEAALGCSGAVGPTWDEAANDAVPINCVDWFTAFAFCIWDGGRLPTDAEAEYAAAGGSRDYRYPWGDTPVLTDEDASASYAVYLCMGDGSAPAACTEADLPVVGSRPLGRGYYQHADLVGSVWEWSLDWLGETHPTTPQTNYARLDAGTYRIARGGSWDSTALVTHSASRTGIIPTARSNTIGFRCARNAR